MHNLIIPKSYQEIIDKFNKGEINNFEDAKNCLLYLQKYPEYYLTYIKDNLFKKNLLENYLDFILVFISIFIFIHHLILKESIFSLSGTIASIMLLSPIISYIRITKKAQKKLKEEEKELIIVMNKRRPKTLQNKQKKTINETIDKNKYIDDIIDLMVRASDIKYPNYEIDIRALSSLAHEYLDQKKAKRLNETKTKELLAKYNCLKPKIESKINLIQNEYSLKTRK